MKEIEPDGKITFLQYVDVLTGILRACTLLKDLTVLNDYDLEYPTKRDTHSELFAYKLALKAFRELGLNKHEDKITFGLLYPDYVLQEQPVVSKEEETLIATLANPEHFERREKKRKSS